MLIKKNIHKALLFFCVMAFTSVSAQKPTVYKINELLNYIFEPNKVKFPFYRIKLENFFNEK